MALTKVTYSMIQGAIANVLDFGADSTGSDDSYTAIQNAIDSLSITGGTVYFPAGTYLVSDEIQANIKGLILQGESCGDKEYTSDNSATIISSATTGSVVRVMRNGIQIRDLNISATTARNTAARNTTSAGYNAGIRFEAEDISGIDYRTSYCNITNVKVELQPNDGIILVAGCFQSAVRDSVVVNCKGSGVVLDAGLRTGRTNIAAPGPVTLDNVVSHFNEGSGFIFGNPNDNASVTVPSLRIVAINCEALSNNCTTTGDITYEVANWYIRGDHISLIQCASYANSASGTPNHAYGIACSGRTHRYTGMRFLSVTTPIKILNYTGVTNNGMVFDGFSIRSMSGSYVCDLISPTTTVSLETDDVIDMPGIDNFVTTKAIEGLRLRRRATRYDNVSIRELDFGSTDNLSIANDAVTTLEMSASGTFGIFTISAPTSGAKPSIIAFRVGSSNYCQTLAGSAVSTTGPLTGTTGSVGDLTISTDSGNNLVYIENRTSATRSYKLTLLSMQNGTLKVV